ncbi:MAG: MFS transporter [Candidatus Izemoplasma sp.]|nr:MFS transporter [Candidatus Izemoplasma sp.]
MSALTFFLSAPGQTYSISVFIDVYKSEFAFSSTVISTAYSVATVISGSMLVFMGRAIDRFGIRRMLIVVPIMLGITTFFNSYVSGIYMIFVGFIFLRYFGQGSMTLIPSTVIPQWFEKRRAFAISLATMGGLLAMLAVPSINLWLISQIGWRNAWRVWSLILTVGFVPLVFLFASNRPEDIGMTIENDVSLDEEAVEKALQKMNQKSFSLKQALRVEEFWIVGMISMIPAMFSTGLAFHFFSVMALRDINSEAAAVILGLLALPAFIMPFVSHIVVDHYPVKYILSTTLTMTILSMLFLIFGVVNATFAVIFILFYGLGIAIQSLSTNVLWPNYFGRKHLGSIRGAATVFMVIGSALGPLPFGISYDITGNYNVAIVGMMIFTAVALVLSFTISKPVKKRV